MLLYNIRRALLFSDVLISSKEEVLRISTYGSDCGFCSAAFFLQPDLRRLEKTIVTAPILFTAVGMLIPLIPQLRDWNLIGRQSFLVVAEIGLVLLLFTDASRTDLGVLKSIRNLPTRLLSTGMLLTILLGGLAAMVVFRQLSIWEAGILAQSLLRPTRALGKSS